MLASKRWQTSVRSACATQATIQATTGSSIKSPLGAANVATRIQGAAHAPSTRTYAAKDWATPTIQCRDCVSGIVVVLAVAPTPAGRMTAAGEWGGGTNAHALA